MTYEKTISVTSLEFASIENSIYLTETTSVHEVDGENKTLISSSNERKKFTPAQKQEALDYGHDGVTALANLYFTQELVDAYNEMLNPTTPEA